MWVYILHPHTNFEVLRPYHSKDIAHLCVCFSQPVTLTFELVTGVQCSTCHGVPSCQFWQYYDYSFSIYGLLGQHSQVTV